MSFSVKATTSPFFKYIGGSFALYTYTYNFHAMRIHFDLNGHYEWVPAPAGTTITQADVDALRAKKATDEDWLIRVIERIDPASGRQHGMVIHEQSIADRYASLIKVGKPETRSQVVEFEVRGSMRHHMHRSHIVKITAEGDEPNEELLRAALARVDVPADEVEEAVRDYMDPTDLSAYLNLAFKTPASKAAKPEEKK
jgi:hypothetical protein